MKRRYVKRLFAMLMVLCLVGSVVAAPALGAEVANATINMDADCKLTIYKYDFTNAAKDGVWSQESYVSTGEYDANVNTILGSANRTGDEDSESLLGNEETSNGYAIKGVEFTYLKVADFYQFSENGTVVLLYKFDKDLSKDLLAAIGLADGARSYADANALDKDYWFYQSDILNAALASSLNSNATTVKNALEAYAKNGGTAMPLTDANGYTSAEGLAVGLYLLVETKVPEMVTNTCNPFFVSLPMTTVNGGGNGTEITDGGHNWNYDVTVYPKNETGIVTLEKTVREALKSTGTHTGSLTDIADGYAHNATASAGDTLEYQIISTLPTITSDATAISDYSFQDVLSRGLTYDSSAGVKIEWFTDVACTDLVDTWTADSGMFSVSQEPNQDGTHTMKIAMTSDGLAVINKANTGADNSNGSLYAGYSNYTMRITYAATVNSDESLVYGDAGNCNEVVLTWKRTSAGYFDTLIDDCHVYSYGINLTKLFSDEKTSQDLFDRVLFKVQNATDGYYVTAALNEAEGVWYVTGFTKNEADATSFKPVTWNNKPGQIVIKGLEDDEYLLTEIQTADGYSLLRDDIHVQISTAEDENRVCDVYAGDTLGVVQNDARYSFDGGMDLKLANISQGSMSHCYLTASATVDGKAVTMLADDMDTDSANALVTLTVVNQKHLNLPQTGDVGAFMLPFIGVIGIISAIALIILFIKRPRRDDEE